MKKLNLLALFFLIFSIILSGLFSTWLVNMLLENTPACGINGIMFLDNCYNIYVYYLCAFLICFLFLNVYVLGLYFMVIYFNVQKIRINKRIRNENIIFERNLPRYNCAVASYLLDGVIEVENDYKALLIEMQEKNLIIKKGDMYIVNAPDLEKLSKVEQYIIKNINNKPNHREFKKCVLDDASNYGLVTWNKLSLLFIFFLVFNVIYLLLFIILSNKTALLQEFGYKLNK